MTHKSIHRVQVNLPPELYSLVRKWAYEENSSISSVLRKTIKTYKEKSSTKTIRGSKWKNFSQRHIGSIAGKQNDSTSHDKWAHKTAIFNSLNK